MCLGGLLPGRSDLQPAGGHMHRPQDPERHGQAVQHYHPSPREKGWCSSFLIIIAFLATRYFDFHLGMDSTVCSISKKGEK